MIGILVFGEVVVLIVFAEDDDNGTSDTEGDNDSDDSSDGGIKKGDLLEDWDLRSGFLGGLGGIIVTSLIVFCIIGGTAG